jgi:hypothetical protein
MSSAHGPSLLEGHAVLSAVSGGLRRIPRKHGLSADGLGPDLASASIHRVALEVPRSAGVIYICWERSMPTTTRNEPTKKHGDKLERLIDQTERDASPEEGENIDAAPADLQDGDDEDIENDDGDDRRDVGQRD